MSENNSAGVAEIIKAAREGHEPRVVNMFRAEWRLEVFGVERTIANVVKDMGETVRQRTGLPVFVGAPES